MMNIYGMLHREAIGFTTTTYTAIATIITSTTT